MRFFLTFSQTVGIFSPIFGAYYPFLSTLFSYLQLWRSYAMLSATTQRAFRPVVDILSINIMRTGWSRLIWHNFVKIADNWIKLFSITYIGTHNRQNRHVKFGLNPTVWQVRKPQGGFLESHCRSNVSSEVRPGLLYAPQIEKSNFTNVISFFNSTIFMNF